MEYSKIKQVRVKNFRSIGDITLDFNDSPIITLVGDNEAGKTSLVKAFCVAGLNAYNKKQKKYIKDGTNGFGIEIQLEDGSIVQRIKTNSSNILKIKRADGTVWETNKIDAGGIPVELQKVMGLVEEPETKEFIQVRTYEDQLLFVVTPASTNYKVMYDALKVENLTKAIKIGTDEANTLRRSLDECTTIKRHIEENIRNTKIVDIEPLINIRNRLQDSYTKLKKIKLALDIKKQLDNFKAEASNLSEISKLNDIDIVKVEHLNNAISLHIYNIINKNKRENLEDINNLCSIDSAIVDKLNTVKCLIDKERYYKNEETSIEYINKLDNLDINLVDKLNSIYNIQQCNSLNAKSMQYADNITKLNIIDVNLYNKAYQALRLCTELKELGVNKEVNSLTEIKETSLHKIDKIIKGLRIRGTIINDYKEYNTLKANIDYLNNILKNSGAKVINCPNCGEEIVLTETI